MSRKTRKMVKVWNKYICPAIECVVAGIALISLFVLMPILLILMCG